MKGPIVHVTTVHPRDDIRIFRKECVSLARAGYEVVQVVGDGLGAAVVDGVRIVDVGRRPAGRLARMREQPRRALAAVKALRPALVHVHDPELLPLARAMARGGVVSIFDAHEDVPRQILTKQWIPAPLRPALAQVFEHIENHLVRELSAVVAATPHIAQRFVGRVPLSVNVSNFPFLNELQASVDPAPRERAVCYVGGLMRTRGLLQMVRAVAMIPDLRLILCGQFEDAGFEAELRAEPGWARVEFLGQVGRDEVRAVMARSRVGLVTLLPLPSYRDALPIKMFEYMSASLPILASDFAMWRAIIEEHRCGSCVDPTDPGAIAGALAALIDDDAQIEAMGAAGRAAVVARYNWPVAERELLGLYTRLLDPSIGHGRPGR